MITVEEAEKIILAEIRDYGAEITPLEHSLGRVLAENIKAGDSFRSSTVAATDGVALNYDIIKAGTSSFHIKGIQATDDFSDIIHEADHCIEITAGSKLPPSVDTVIRYEDLEIRAGIASLLVDHHIIKKGSNIHHRDQAHVKNGFVATIGEVITPEMINLIASTSETELRVKKVPKIAIVSLNVDPAQTYNSYAVNAILQQNRIEAIVPQVPNNIDSAKSLISEYLKTYDVLLLCGDTSQVQESLADQQLNYLFNEVHQLPGKAFCLGKNDTGTLIFAFPGDMDAINICLHRYFLPWYHAALGIKYKADIYAVLTHDIHFQPDLTYFVQVELVLNEKGRLMAYPVQYNITGVHSANAFMELPAGKHSFKKDELYKVYPTSRIV